MFGFGHHLLISKLGQKHEETTKKLVYVAFVFLVKRFLPPGQFSVITPFEYVCMIRVNNCSLYKCFSEIKSSQIELFRKKAS